MDIAAFRMDSVNLGADADLAADRLQSATITPSTFELLRVAPSQGRALTETDGQPGSPPS